MDAAVIELRTYVDTVIQHRDTGTYHRGARVAEVERAQSFRIAVVGGLVDSLVFRHNTSIRLAYRSADKGYRLADYLIGHYTVRYADGSRETLDLHYGRNISNADVDWGRSSLPYTYSSALELLQAACYTRPWVKGLNNRDHVTVYDYEWANPHPDRELESVSLTLAEKGVPYSIFVYDIYGIRLREGQARWPASA
jgi:hypothetical protein